ncbi:MAG: hypothetical protein WC700_18030 [Gemmatimonadaceae bacterium]|jgi:hypothetical protein
MDESLCPKCGFPMDPKRALALDPQGEGEMPIARHITCGDEIRTDPLPRMPGDVPALTEALRKARLNADATDRVASDVVMGESSTTCLRLLAALVLARDVESTRQAEVLAQRVQDGAWHR